ncbi:MAG TPA: hypothetical protein DD473_02640 [Planctomycetaceae bacterium]|nr:hypothetical protein [Planctomycetaceae bacterium]|tara:strand:+ start:312 stop:1094 length:783 start_codon:yes stop_codon:yes gene_type:complete
MTIHFGNPDKPDTIQDAIGRYNNSEFRSITRSTIPMLSLLAHEPKVFQNLVGETKLPIHYHTYLEYTVSPKLGRGKASHTDVMLIDGNASLAIEAKWIEGMYPKVQDWISQGSNEQNRKDVLKGWVDCLGNHLGQELNPDDFHGVIYQMIHRAASAVVAGKKPSVAYFCFKMKSFTRGAKIEQIEQRLTELWILLGQPENFPFFVAEIEIKEEDAYKNLQEEAKTKSKEEISELVIAALQDNESLFTFLPKPVVRIGSHT